MPTRLLISIVFKVHTHTRISSTMIHKRSTYRHDARYSLVFVQIHNNNNAIVCSKEHTRTKLTVPPLFVEFLRLFFSLFWVRRSHFGARPLHTSAMGTLQWTSLNFADSQCRSVQNTTLERTKCHAAKLLARPISLFLSQPHPLRSLCLLLGYSQPLHT